MAHASAENNSNLPRTLFIFNIGAADAVRLTPCALPSIHQSMIVRGKEPGRIRDEGLHYFSILQIPQESTFPR